MTTATWSSGNSHTSDAEFRAWGSEFSSKLAAVGLIQTTDTGQINWATVTKPGTTNTNAGYEIWRFNDPAQSTSPLFLKISYGNGSNVSLLTPRIQIEVGTATNGAGTLSGIGSGVQLPGSNNVGSNAGGSATAQSSYMCYVDGFFGFVWKRSATNQGYFFLSRTCDATGTPDGSGYLIWALGSNAGASGALSNIRMVRLESPATVVYSTTSSTGEAGVAITPGYLSSTTLPNGDKQAYMVWTANPDMRPIFSLCAVLPAEFAAGTTFSTAMVGSAARTFLNTGVTGNNVAINSAGYQMAMLWE